MKNDIKLNLEFEYLFYKDKLDYNKLSKFKFHKGHIKGTVTVTTRYKGRNIEIVHALSPTVLEYCNYPPRFIKKANSFLQHLDKKYNFTIKLKPTKDLTIKLKKH